ncbi:MAG: ABC transporter ATP-binding protein [Tissierellia bacterium]|nr:ABC transporter ATP-binding protein [Tissierellia bacterium]
MLAEVICMDDYRSNINVWKEYFNLIISQKKLFITLFILNIVIGILDAAFPLFTRYAVDNFIVNSSLNGLREFMLVFIIIALFQSFNIYLFVALNGKMETIISYTIRKRAFENLQIQPLSFYDKKAIGWLMARLTSDITRISEIISWGFGDLAWGLAMMIAVAVSMLLLNLKLALITLTVVPLLAVVSIYFQRKILSAQRKVRKINSHITAQYNEGISGAKTTKILNREEINLLEFSNLTQSMKAASVKATLISSLYIPIVIILGSIGTALVMTYGGIRVATNTISYGTIVAFISYSMQFFEPIRQLATIIAEVQSAKASAERVFFLIEEVPDIADQEEAVEKYGDFFNPKKENWPEIKGKVEFKNVFFAYEDGELILENFNLTVEAGESIALVGETGSGKSTIVNLLCRFYEPTRGEILIDGINYKDMPQVWIHENLGYVLQSPHLFSGTIKENIKYGNLDASDEEIIEACKLVNCHDFIVKMEKGYDTEVAQGGSSLSTGQKQLISLARAIVRNPKIFVLDEATSSIDTETESIIQSAIDKVLKGRTSFIIAHRLSTIKKADRILVIKDGKIIEEGKHKDLIARKGYYYKLYTNQYIEEKSREVLSNMPSET